MKLNLAVSQAGLYDEKFHWVPKQFSTRSLMLLRLSMTKNKEQALIGYWMNILSVWKHLSILFSLDSTGTMTWKT
jgi:hypothetical protein